ncbi:membrane protein [Staphylococcus piscifermentans]|uniref:DUF4064 domain-containing protein n=1 Tax=Staphylococcus piscifermentans TaxID=70258 RepID=A0A239U861_9STAP|nr:DUF4064 domain-containing protein [Staphylococcus piscifermentans]RTX84761.1 DUF4064 domain-containing protein [Staphylococcus piscifermentans]GEP85433.1 hypothetical protein SPI02_20180 [Staphylococcus piscifermentans]SNV06150.1 membrane protein [Staphylococcus piscifermentans]
MNRKLERVIGWIGVGLTLLYTLLFLIGLAMGKGAISKLLLKQGDSSMSASYLQHSMIFEAVSLIVVAIIAAIGIVLSKKNRILGGVLLVIAAVIGVFLSNFIASILFFIAGIMLFVRRSQKKHRENQEYDRKHGYFDATTSKDDDLDELHKKGKVDPNLEDPEHYSEAEHAAHNRKERERRESGVLGGKKHEHENNQHQENNHNPKEERIYTEERGYDKKGNEFVEKDEETFYEDNKDDISNNDLTSQRRRNNDERPSRHDLDDKK